MTRGPRRTGKESAMRQPALVGVTIILLTLAGCGAPQQNSSTGATVTNSSPGPVSTSDVPSTEDTETSTDPTTPTTTGRRGGKGSRIVSDPRRLTADDGAGSLDADGNGAVFDSSNEAGETNTEATTAYVKAVVAHADKVWSAWFTNNGLPEPWVGVEIIEPGQSYTSKCQLNGSRVIRSDTVNAAYCPSDQNGHDRGVLILPVVTLARMWTGDIFSRQVRGNKRVGDFAAAVVVAHEFGHHVQDELAQDLDKTPPRNPNTELIADCFAGVWAHTVFVDGYLEAGDLDEAINALGVIGDTHGSHGTNQQRVTAFRIGYFGSKANPTPGLPANCITAFWPGF